MNCKLVGQFVQHLEVTLSPGEDFYAEKGSCFLYTSDAVEEHRRGILDVDVFCGGRHPCGLCGVAWVIHTVS